MLVTYIYIGRRTEVWGRGGGEREEPGGRLVESEVARINNWLIRLELILFIGYWNREQSTTCGCASSVMTLIPGSKRSKVQTPHMTVLNLWVYKQNIRNRKGWWVICFYVLLYLFIIFFFHLPTYHNMWEDTEKRYKSHPIHPFFCTRFQIWLPFWKCGFLNKIRRNKTPKPNLKKKKIRATCTFCNEIHVKLNV